MVEYIIKHIELIGSAIGVLFIMMLVANLKYLTDTKYEQPIIWIITIVGIIGAATIGETVAKWLIK